ncbi:MAG: LCP family protein [Patescibacteria group bacterium]|nr:LCP family protein [Patescibacteria group bacterium]
MNSLKIDLIAEAQGDFSAPAGHEPIRIIVKTLVIGVIFALSFGAGRLSLSPTATAALATLNELPFFSQMHLIGSADRRIIGEEEDRINILLLGMGGDGHEGPLLTDTIMVASFRPSDKQVALLSIPRDLVVPLPKYGWRKINAANAYGEMETPGQGAEASRLAIEGLLGIDIPYYVRIDFSGFRQIIDDVDGVDITVDRAFSDASYPTNQHGYQTVAFQAGPQHMDGETALQFTRSRHGNNGEGSDFARAKRQQKVLTALKTKLMEDRNLRSASVISNLLSTLHANIATNLQIGEILRLAKMTKDIDTSNIRHVVIDDSPGSPLVSAWMNGAFVMVPRNDDWGLLRSAATGVFGNGVADATGTATGQAAAAHGINTSVVGEPNVAPSVEVVGGAVEIQNGSGAMGLARTVAGRLAEHGFTVTKIGNADSFKHSRTLILDLTDGKKSAALENLRAALGAEAETADPRTWRGTRPDNADFLVILGQDAATS